MLEISNKKNYVLTWLASFAGIIVSTVVGFLSVPLALDYWNVQRYGIWAIINSIIVYLSLSNLGINSATAVLMAKNNNFWDKIKILKKSFDILMISTVISCTFFIILNTFYKDWILFIGNIPENLKAETLYACLILGIFFFINLPLSLISSALSGLQKLYVEKIFSVCQTLISFFSLILVIYLKGNLITFAIFNGLANLIINMIKAAYFYLFIYSNIKSKSNQQNMELKKNKDISYKNIIMSSMRFFSTGIAAMFVWNTDNLVISNFIGISEVTPYSITFKLYSILIIIITMTNASLTPIIGKEFGSGNWNWLNKTYNKLVVIITTIGGLTWLGGILFFKDIIYLWTGTNGYAGLLTVFALGGYTYLLSMVNLNSGILNSFNYIKGIHLVSWAEALINLSCSIILLKHMGIGGVAMGTFLGSLLSCCWILPLLIKIRTQNKIKYNKLFVLNHLFLLLLPLITVGILIQLYVSAMHARIILGCFIILIYLLISYALIPGDVKTFLNQELLNKFKKHDS